jgi:glycosyltransferase involved in cell wall biosynthesis
MKIEFTLHDEPSSDAGGMGVTTGLADVYRELGHEVRLLCFGDLPEWMAFRFKTLLFPGVVAARLWRADLDVIDSAVGDAALLAPLCSRRRGPRPLLVFRSHGLAYTSDKANREEAARGNLHLSWKYPLYWGGVRLKEEKLALHSSDLCLFLNERERAIAIEELGVEEERAHLVDNGLPAWLIGRPLEPLAPPTETVRIAHIGSYLPHKGIHYLVEAIESFFARHQVARATLFGTIADRDSVLADFQPALRSRIDVVPTYHRQDLPELLKGHAVVLSASLREGFPLGTLEAMACGLVPVITDIPGPTQYVRDNDNGLVVPVADAAALATAVDRLIRDPELFGRLRAAAHATAQEYSWERVGKQTLELYSEALARLRPGSRADSGRVAAPQ